MPDLYASMVSAGVVYTHEAIAYYGTAGVLPVMKDSALNAAWKPFPIAERGGKIQEGYLFDYPVYSLSVGDGVHWFREQFAPFELEAEKRDQAVSAYALLDQLAAQVPAGSEGLIHLPYFQGQRSPEFNPYASGVFFGMKNTHTWLTFRALLESWGYSIRHGLDCTYPAGHPIQRLVATGGGARSPLWRQIVSDITGMRQEWVKEADGPLGAAYLAGLAVGIFSDFVPLQSEWVRSQAVTEPDPEAYKIYDQYYPVYVELHSALKA
jgi:xylulokinase